MHTPELGKSMLRALNVVKLPLDIARLRHVQRFHGKGYELLSGYHESTLFHTLKCIRLSRHFFSEYPQALSMLDTYTVYLNLLWHDIGEIGMKHDITVTNIADGVTTQLEKNMVELAQVFEFIKPYPAFIQKHVLDNHLSYTSAFETKDPNALFANLVNAIEGTQTIRTHLDPSPDAWTGYHDLTSHVLNTKIIPTMNYLYDQTQGISREAFTLFYGDILKTLYEPIQDLH